MEDLSINRPVLVPFRGQNVLIRVQIREHEKEVSLVAEEFKRKTDEPNGSKSREFLTALHRKLHKNNVSHKSFKADGGKAIDRIVLQLGRLISFTLQEDEVWTN